MTEEVKDLILKLLMRDPKKRIGSFKDSEEILSHPWFNSIDLNKLVKKEIPANYKPAPKPDDQD